MLKEVLTWVLFGSAILTPRAFSAQYHESTIGISKNFSTDSDPQLKIVYPDELSPMKGQLEKLCVEALAQASTRLELRLRDNVTIFFDTRALEHNGLTTVIPKNRILVYPEAPEVDSSISFSDDYLRETLIHEMGHMLSIQQRAGAFSFFSHLIGNGSRPNGLWPRWIHEGLAVWTEEVMGGRPKSGAIHRDLRLFQEIARRKKNFTIPSDDLSGDDDSASIPAGRFPYSFGYLLMQDIHSKIGPKKWIESSSHSLGMSFRPTLRSMNFDLDQEFKKLQDQWRAQAPTAPSPLPQWVPVSKAKRILGPFRIDDDVSWIETSGRNKKPMLVSLNPILGPEKIPAPRNLGSIESAFHLSSGEWILLVKTFADRSFGPFFNPQQPYKKVLGIWRPREKTMRCTFPVQARTRDVAFNDGRITWVESQTDGLMTLKSARWNESCDLVSEETLSRGSQAFERISSPSLRRNLLTWTESDGRNLFKESVYASDGRRVSAADPLTQSEMVSADSLIAIRSNQHQWGPVFIDLKKKTLREIPVETSIRRAIVARGHVIALREFWDSEEIVKLPLEQAMHVDGVSDEKVEVGPRIAKTIPAGESSSVAESDYRALADTVPSFWSPIVGADGSGYFLAGSTFFSDLSNRYTGAMTGGYSSLTKKGFFDSQFKFNSTADFPMPSPLLAFAYSPRYLGVDDKEQLAQNRLIVSTSFQYPAHWQKEIFLTLGLGFGFERQQKTYYLDGGNLWIPAISFGLKNREGREPTRSPNSLVDAPFSVYATGRLRRVKDFEGNLALSLEHPWFRKAGARWQIEGGMTALVNRQYSYFIIGGNALLNTNDQGDYLTRGYPYRLGIAQGVLRFAHESDFQLMNGGPTVGWSRFRINSTNLRLIAETVTYDSFSSTVHFTDYFFHTLGAELRTYGKALGYVEFEAALGYYCGLSKPQNNEFSITLRTWLDL